jgi:hypothetical protein
MRALGRRPERVEPKWRRDIVAKGDAATFYQGASIAGGREASRSPSTDPLGNRQSESSTLKHKAARPCIAFGTAPDVSKPRSWSDPIRSARTCDLSQGLAMISTKAFLLGFVGAWAPILIYTAWITWRIAEAI